MSTDLQSKLTAAERAYNSGSPIMSDAAYDALQLAAGKPKGSSSEVVSTKVRHVVHMGSLENAYDEADTARLSKTWPAGAAALVMPKLDGLSCEIVYEDGVFAQASTRGDGDFGEDITEAMRPLVPARHSARSVRGEIVMPLSVFDAKHKDTGAANPRNLAAGLIRRKSDAGAAATDLHFIAFTSTDTGTPSERHAKLAESGFRVVESRRGDLSCDFSALKGWRDGFDYATDGVVFCANVDDADLWHTDMARKCPRAAFAFKFPAEAKTTTVIGIECSIGVHGTLTPVLEVAPVSLSGTIVRRASLHNFDFLSQHDLRKGCEVELEKSGEIIPYVLRVTSRENQIGDALSAPNDCPCCGSRTERTKNIDGSDGVHVRCSNVMCPDRLTAQLVRFCKTLGILGMGEANAKLVVTAAVSAGSHPIPHLCACTEGELASALGSEAIAAKLHKQLVAARGLEMSVFLDALGIPGLGTSSSKKLGHLHHRALLTLTPDISQALGSAAPQVVAHMNDNSAWVDAAAEILNPAKVQQAPVNSNAIGVAVTGTLSRPRVEIESLINLSGSYTFTDGVKKNTKFLVAADPNGGSSKLEAARKKGVQVISEAELISLLGQDA